MNAATGQELTQFYVRVPDRYLPLALEILSDIVWSPALRADEVESERQVILEEIRMRDDTPDDLVHDLFAEALVPEPPARARDRRARRRPSPAMPRDAIAEYHRAHYQPDNMVVAVAGNFEHDDGREDGRSRAPGANGSLACAAYRRGREAGDPKAVTRPRATARAGAPRARHPCVRP